MVGIGLRVTSNEVYYSIIELNEEELNEEELNYDIISISSLKVPKALDTPSKLSFVRNTMSTIIKQYSITIGGIRLMEGNSRGGLNHNMFFRLNLEGVLLELFDNSNIEYYFLGMSSNISRVFDVNNKPVKEVFFDLDLEHIKKTDDAKVVNDNYKEAIVVGIAALHQRRL